MPTTITDINEAANDLLVHRLSIDNLEKQYQNIISVIPQLVEITDQIASEKLQRDEAQKKLLEVMAEAQLKSWKTEKANFARTERRTASINPAFKQMIEKKLKSGEDVDGWTLNITEYLSIRINPKK